MVNRFNNEPGNANTNPATPVTTFTPSTTTSSLASEPWLEQPKRPAAPAPAKAPAKAAAVKKPAAKKPAATKAKAKAPAEKKTEKWWHDPGHGDTGPRHEAQRVRDEAAGYGQPALDPDAPVPVVPQGPRPLQNLRRPVGF